MSQVLKSQLDLFSSVPIQKDVIRTESLVVNPICALDGPSLDFISPGVSDAYKDLSNIYLRLLLKLPTSVKTGTEEATQATVVNNIINSLFSQCQIYLNNVNVSNNEGDFAYRCYLEKLLNHGEESANTHLQSGGWYLDESKLDDMSGTNLGYEKRKLWFTNGKTVEVYGRLTGDILNQHKYLISGVDLRINLIKSSPNFHLMSVEKDKSEIQILESNLFIEHAYVNPNLILAHNKLLESNKPLNYHIKRLQIRQYTIGANVHSVSLDNVIIGQLPNLLIFGMVSSEAYSGKRSKNPFNFEHFNLSSIQLSVNGYSIPTKPLEMNFVNESQIYSRAYFNLFRALQLQKSDQTNQVKMTNFNNGFTLIPFDLTRDANYGGLCLSQLSEGVVRLELKFSKATPSSITALIATEFDGCISIDKNRSVNVVF